MKTAILSIAIAMMIGYVVYCFIDAFTFTNAVEDAYNMEINSRCVEYDIMGGYNCE